MPDVGAAAYQVAGRQKVILACEKWWSREGPHGLENSSDCSGFVASVAAELGVDLGGSANEMFGAIKKPWSILGFGDSAAHLAAVAATNGLFVVGAWKNPSPSGSGHLAVVLDTNYSSQAVPHRTRAIAYWGTLGAEGAKYSKHSESWGAAKRPNVLYAAHHLALCRVSAAARCRGTPRPPGTSPAG